MFSTAVTRLSRASGDPALGRRLGWAALSPALAAVYGVVVVAVLVSTALSVLGVGLLLLAPLLSLSRALATFERQQARDLLVVDVPDLSAPSPAGLRSRLADPEAWRAVGWLALRALIGVALAGVLVVAVLTAVALAVMPFDPGYLQWGAWSSPGGIAYMWAPLLIVPLGVLVLVLGAGVARVAVQLAPAALGADHVRFEALRRRAQGLDDRTRLAQELHDAIGHTLTTTVLQAEAAQALMDDRPVEARASLKVIERSARQALDELDRVLGMLRRTPAGEAPPPDLHDVPGLIEAVRAAGLTITLEAAAAPPLDGLSGQAAYRVLQESLTNVLRHAGPVATSVRLRVDDRAIHLRVANAPSVAEHRSAVVGGGVGLGGLSERCQMLGGSLTSGPTADGGYLVQAVIPR